MEIVIPDSVAQELESLPIKTQKRIANKMRFYSLQNDPLKFAKHLTSSRLGNFRFRIGDYRVLFDVVDHKIVVVKIGKRDEAYE